MDKEQATKALTEPTKPSGNDEAANLLMDEEEDDGEPESDRPTDRRE